eukprot:1149248-Pleurochrysis_carterae.AAC.1
MNAVMRDAAFGTNGSESTERMLLQNKLDSDRGGQQPSSASKSGADGTAYGGLAKGLQMHATSDAPQLGWLPRGLKSIGSEASRRVPKHGFVRGTVLEQLQQFGCQLAALAAVTEAQSAEAHAAAESASQAAFMLVRSRSPVALCMRITRAQQTRAHAHARLTEWVQSRRVHTRFFESSHARAHAS